MGKQYTHFTIEERCELARLHAAGHSHREIAAALDRAPSTIAREVKRNGTQRDGYQARYWRGGGAAASWSGMLRCARPWIQYGWSPEQVAGFAGMTVYFLYARDQERELAALPAACHGGIVGLLHCAPERPQAAADRQTPGH